MTIDSSLRIQIDETIFDEQKNVFRKKIEDESSTNPLSGSINPTVGVVGKTFGGLVTSGIGFLAAGAFFPPAIPFLLVGGGIGGYALTGAVYSEDNRKACLESYVNRVADCARKQLTGSSKTEVKDAFEYGRETVDTEIKAEIDLNDNNF